MTEQVSNNNSKSDEIKQLQQEALIIENRVVERHSKNDKLDAQDITMWASILEHQYILNDNKWLISNISTAISERLRARGSRYWYHAHDYLDERFKNPALRRFNPTADLPSFLLQQQQQQQQQEQSSSTGRQTFALYVKNTIENLYNQIEENHQGNPEVLREAFEGFEKYLEEIRKKCDMYHVNLVNQFAYAESRKDEEIISIAKPKSMATIASETAREYAKIMWRVADSLEKMPPELEEDQQSIARGFKAMIKFWQPFLDLKWTKSWPAWFRIEKDRMDYGKHAAAVRNYTITNLCPMCSNTKEDVENKVYPVHVELVPNRESPTGVSCPKCGCTMGLRRNMTREQVGDKSIQVIRYAWNVFNAWPEFKEAIYHHIKQYEARAGARKNNLSGKLSDKA